MNNPKEQFRAGIIPQRIRYANTLKIGVSILVCLLIATIIVACVSQFFVVFIVLGGIVVIFIVIFAVWNVKIKKVEEQIQIEKFRKMVNEIVEQDEYELPVMDYGFSIKVTKSGFTIDNETFGFDNFDIFMGTTNLCHQASVAFFVVSNFSPFSDDKTYPINFGIACDSLSLGCAKKFFFEPDYKAFNYLIENPEESAKEILKYGLLKVQIEERKKARALEKLATEMVEE